MHDDVFVLLSFLWLCLTFSARVGCGLLMKSFFQCLQKTGRNSTGKNTLLFASVCWFYGIVQMTEGMLSPSA